jgi:hypothetical protein
MNHKFSLIFSFGLLCEKFTVGCSGVCGKVIALQWAFIDHLNGIFEIDLRTKYANTAHPIQIYRLCMARLRKIFFHSRLFFSIV